MLTRCLKRWQGNADPAARQARPNGDSSGGAVSRRGSGSWCAAPPGTRERFHSELGSAIGLEGFPSGKSVTNGCGNTHDRTLGSAGDGYQFL